MSMGMAVAAVMVGVALWPPGRQMRWPADQPAPRPSGQRARSGAGGGAGGLAARGRSGRAAAQPSTSEVAAALELVALALTSGGSVLAAVEVVAAGELGIAGAELKRVGAAVRWGLRWADAWQLASPVWASARAAMAVAELAGVGPAVALQRVADDVRAARSRHLEIAAARLGVLLVLPLGLAFLPAFVLLVVVPLVVALAGDLLGSG